MYQKYVFKITAKNIISDEEVLIRNLTQNPNKLDINKKDGVAIIGDRTVKIEIIYHGIDKKSPTGIIKVTSDKIEDLEIFDKTLTEIMKTEGRFSKFTCINDGISSYYSTKIYSELHNIERKTLEFLKELFYISDNDGSLKQFTSTLKDMKGKYFSFSKLINIIFQREQVSDAFLEHIQSCIESNSVPKKDLLPKSLWDNSSFTGSKEEGMEINDLLDEIRQTRNIITHCKPFNRYDFDNCDKKVHHLYAKLDKIIMSIEKESGKNQNTENIEREAARISDSLQSEDNEIKRLYFKAYKVFEKDLIAMHGKQIDMKKLSGEDEEHFEFYLKLSEKSDEEIKEETDKLELVNNVEQNNLGDVTENDDLTLIVPAQEEGFKRVFLGQKEWYDIRIGKMRINKIRYIAAYEVAPKSGIKYWAEVDKIVPSDNYIGYWKVIFKDNKVEEYPEYKRLGDTWPPQNIRYTSKKVLDSATTLAEVFNSPI